MEELRKLERVQRMVEFMESRGVSASNSDHNSNRFLANFMLLLMEPCGELGMDEKCCLVSELMPRVSSTSTSSFAFCFDDCGNEMKFELLFDFPVLQLSPAFLEDAYQHHVTAQDNSGKFVI